VVAVGDDNSVVATVERDGDLVAARDGATGAVRGTVDLASAGSERRCQAPPRRTMLTLARLG